MKNHLGSGRFSLQAHVVRSVCLLGLAAAASSLLRAQNASQIVGPDGLPYPDWRAAGVQGGIPTVTNVIATITSTQATTDLAGAIQSAVNGATGPGLIQLPLGTYSLATPVFIAKSGIVITGGNSSNNGTTINFTFQPPSSQQAVFFQPASTVTTLYGNTWVSVQADTANLKELDIWATPPGGARTLVSSISNTSVGVWGNSFSIDTSGQDIMNAIRGASSALVEGVATYVSGTQTTISRTFTLTAGIDSTATPRPTLLGAINFAAYGDANYASVNLQASALAGTTTLQMPTGHGFNVGDDVVLQDPTDLTFNNATGNTCPYTTLFRCYQFQVTGTTATSITLNQPLRIDFPIDASTTVPPYVYKIQTIQNCGVQNLTLAQTYNVWTCGVTFTYGWNCWTQNIVVNQTGRHPVWFCPGKWCEIYDCTFNGTWWLGDGGSGYVGFDRAYDCLVDTVTCSNLRHGPIVVWSAAGNVFRNSTFLNTDPQWHGGWTNNNLYENNVVLSTLNVGNSGFGSYGDTGYSSAPNDPLHGPNGPDNVVYNNDFSGPGSYTDPIYAGTFLGGGNNDGYFLWNRFGTDLGYGFYTQQSSSDHLIQNNVFVMGQAPAAIDFSDAASNGTIVSDNLFFGPFHPTAALITGEGTPGTVAANTVTDELQAVTFPNGGFETGSLSSWSNSGDGGMSTVTTGAAHLGSYGLNVTDASTTAGSSLLSSAFTVSPGNTYATRFFYRINSESSAASAGVYLKFFNSGGTEVLAPNSTENPGQIFTLQGAAGAGWVPALLAWEAPPTAATAQVYVHSFGAATCNIDFDNFEFGVISKLANSSLAFDAGFEGGEWVGWNNAGDGGMSTIIADPANSNYNHILQVADTSATAGSSLTSPLFAAVAGDTYDIRFSAVNISNSAGYGTGVYLTFYNAGGVQLSQSTLTVPISSAWNQYEFRGVAPYGTATAQLWIHSYIGSVTTEDFDNFAVLELPPRPMPNGSSVASIYAWELNPVYPLVNPGFATGNLTGWSTTSNGGDNGMSSVTTTAAHMGTYGLKVVDTSATLGSSLLSQSFGAASGVQLTLSFWAKMVSGSGIGVYLEYYDVYGNALTPGLIDIPGTDTSWTQLQQTFTAPASTASVAIWIHSYDGYQSTTYLDDFALTQVIPPP